MKPGSIFSYCANLIGLVAIPVKIDVIPSEARSGVSRADEIPYHLIFTLKDKMANLVKFINNSPSFGEALEQLRAKPYSLAIKQGDEPGYEDLWVFSYNQIESDSKLPIVQESRGIILKLSRDPEDSVSIVCYPFKRFFNWGESNAQATMLALNWETLYGLDKLDGSLIKLYYYNNKWNVATRNGITMQDAKFIAMWNSVRGRIDESKLNQAYTYMFELVGQDNKIVVNYPENDLYHLGTRSLSTLEELEVDIGIKKPTLYKLSSIEQYKELVSKFSPTAQEGVVIVDDKYNRLKLKNETYIVLHHMLGTGLATDQLCLKLLLMGEKEEFLLARPDLQDQMLKTEDLLDKFIQKIEDTHQKILQEVGNSSDKKAFALQVQQHKPPIPAIHYGLNTKKITSIREFLSDKYGTNSDLKELLSYLN